MEGNDGSTLALVSGLAEVDADGGLVHEEPHESSCLCGGAQSVLAIRQTFLYCRSVDGRLASRHLINHIQLAHVALHGAEGYRVVQFTIDSSEQHLVGALEGATVDAQLLE